MEMSGKPAGLSLQPETLESLTGGVGRMQGNTVAGLGSLAPGWSSAGAALSSDHRALHLSTSTRTQNGSASPVTTDMSCLLSLELRTALSSSCPERTDSQP